MVLRQGEKGRGVVGPPWAAAEGGEGLPVVVGMCAAAAKGGVKGCSRLLVCDGGCCRSLVTTNQEGGRTGA